MVTDSSSGLSEREASERLAREGFNEIPSSDRSGLLRAAGDVLGELMFLLLLACGGIYVLVGDLHEALILLGFVVLARMMALKKVSSPTTASDTESSMGKTSPPSAARGPGGRGRSPGDPRGAVAGDVPIVLVAVGRRHQQPDVLPQHLLRGVPEHALGAGVEERDLAALGDADDGVLRGVEDDASSGVFGAPLATSWPSLREPVRGRGSPREGGSSRASPR
jgi:P-type Ca2+ transporter type 2C